jgi:hypothetical protein
MDDSFLYYLLAAVGVLLVVIFAFAFLSQRLLYKHQADQARRELDLKRDLLAAA